MEAVYEWIQQMAVFAVISFLVLYLMGNQSKKLILRFYLSLLMLFLVLRPAAGLLNLDTALVQKLKELEVEADAEMAAVTGQIQEITGEQDQKILEEASGEAISWLKSMAQEANLEFLEGEVQFDEETLEQTGELLINRIRLTVSRAGKSAGEIRPFLEDLKTSIAQEFALDESSVSVTARE